MSYTEQMITQQNNLSKVLGVITLPSGETTIEDAIKALRKMLETFRKRNWDLREIGERQFVLELPNENALNYLTNKQNWSCKERKSFRIKRWTEEENLRVYRFSKLLCLLIKGLPLQAWTRTPSSRSRKGSATYL